MTAWAQRYTQLGSVGISTSENPLLILCSVTYNTLLTHDTSTICPMLPKMEVFVLLPRLTQMLDFQVTKDKVHIVAAEVDLYEGSPLYDPCKDFYLETVTLRIQVNIPFPNRDATVRHNETNKGQISFFLCDRQKMSHHLTAPPFGNFRNSRKTAEQKVRFVC